MDIYVGLPTFSLAPECPHLYNSRIAIGLCSKAVVQAIEALAQPIPGTWKIFSFTKICLEFFKTSLSTLPS